MTLNRKIWLSSFFVMILMLTSCSDKSTSPPPSSNQGTRDNTPMVLEPVASGDEVIGNQKITFDISHKN